MRNIFLLCALSIGLCSIAQDQIGHRISNYAGTDAVALDPARSVYQWQYMDFTVLGVGASVWNNYVYLGSGERTAFGELNTGISSGFSDMTLERAISNRDKKANVFLEVNGPAFMGGFGRNAIGAHVTHKTQVSVSGLQSQGAEFLWNDLDIDGIMGEGLRNKNLRITANSYTEVGGTFARQLVARGNTLLSAGGTLKYLIGHGGGGILVNDLDFTPHSDTSFTLSDLNGSYGFVDQPAIKAGSGLGFDIGIHFQRTLNEMEDYVPHSTMKGCEPQPYRYRISFSILDVGGINYQAQTGSFDAAVGTVDDINALDIDDVQQLDSILQANLNGYQQDTEYRVGLASALAVQADVRLAEKLYIGLMGLQPIGGGSNLRIRRNAYLAAVPRVETERVTVSLPITFMEYQKPQIGLAMRFNNVVIGSDNVFPWLSKNSRVFGADVYAKLKFTLFRRSSCRDRSPKPKADVAMEGQSAMPCVLPE